MVESPRLSEFSGVAGEVLRRSVSLSSLFSGLVLAFLLIVGNWVLFQAGTPGASTPYTQILFALATARFALNGLFGEWGGSVFSTRGGSWVTVAAICARYLALTAVWLVPLLLLGPGQEEFAALVMLGPAAAGKVLGVLGLYLLALMLTPPIFLIVAAKAERFVETFTPDLWRTVFGGRLGDLLVIYALYVGGVTMVCVLSLPVVFLGFAIGRAPGVIGTAAIVCLVLGVSTNLLGRLCGFFACGELGFATPSVTRATATPAAPGGLRVTAPPATAASPATVVAFPREAAAASAAVPIAAAAAATATQLPPLMDAHQRVAKLMERLEGEPAIVLGALEDLHRSYAANPAVQQALVAARNRNGQGEAALALGREALPLCFERGNIQLAAAIFRELRPHVATLGVSRDQVLTIAGALHKMGDLNAAAKTYTHVLSADPGETRAIKGMLQVGDQILEKSKRPDQAAKVYRYLIEHCGQSPLAEYMRQGLASAERLMR